MGEDENKHAQPESLESRLRRTRALLAVHKARHAQKLSEGEDEAALGELAMIQRMEIAIANMEQYVRIRALTGA